MKTKAATSEEETHVLNVDLDILSDSPLDPLLTALSEQVDVLHVGRRGRRHVARLEVGGSGWIDRLQPRSGNKNSRAAEVNMTEKRNKPARKTASQPARKTASKAPRKAASKPPRKRTPKESADPLWAQVEEHYPVLLQAYQEFEDKRPVLLIDVQEQRIYAHDYASFRASLSARSQASLKAQYEEALEQGTIVVFVRDNVAEKLVSYSIERF